MGTLGGWQAKHARPNRVNWWNFHAFERRIDRRFPKEFRSNSDGGFSIILKDNWHEPHYLIRRMRQRISNYSRYTASVLVEPVSGDPKFYDIDGGGEVATVNPFLFRNDGEVTATQKSGRWWHRYPTNRLVMGEEKTFDIDLIDVGSWLPWPAIRPGETLQTEWNQAKRRSNLIGMTFGNTTGLGHGWRVKGGDARLTIKFKLIK